MKKGSNEVFLFTFIDLLVQLCFFSLFTFVTYQAIESRNRSLDSEAQRNREAKVFKAAGVSNLTELTDYLSRLAPPQSLIGFSEFHRRGGKLEKLQGMEYELEKEGGINSVKEKLAKLRKIEEGFGKPPCLSEIRNGKRVELPVATVVGTDSTIRFTGKTAEMDQVLAMLGQNYSMVQSMSFAEFARAFEPLKRRKPDCLYMLDFVEQTRFVDARDAARGIFRLSIR